MRKPSRKNIRNNKTIKCLFICVSCVFVSSIAFAANETSKIKIPKEILNHKKNSFITLTVENDMFGSGTDNNYTSGVRLSYFQVGNGDDKQWLKKLFPLFTFNETTSTAYSIGQNMYTPNNITTPYLQYNDRPWGAFLYGSVGLSSLVNHYVDDIELALGMIGPAALGEQAQKFIHAIVGSPKPLGWSNQLKNEPGIVLSFRRRWPVEMLHNIKGLSISTDFNIGGSIGNVYTLAETGMMIRISPSEDRWQDTPMLVRPSMPGSGFFHTEENNVSWYVFSGVQGRAIARNIFLDGNTFVTSHSVTKKPFVADAIAGLAMAYQHIRVSYTAVFRTKEFTTQLNDTFFGAISMGYRC